MNRLAETGRAVSLIGPLSLCARLIHNALKRVDLAEEDRVMGNNLDASKTLRVQRKDGRGAISNIHEHNKNQDRSR